MKTFYHLHSKAFFANGSIPPLHLDGFEQLHTPQGLMQADVLIVHLPSILVVQGPDSLKQLRMVAPKGQIWVGDSLESATNYPAMDDPSFMALFDIEMSYREKADLWTPYIGGEFPMRFKEAEPVKARKRFCCAFVSSGFNASGRKALMKGLMKRFRVDSYGKVYRNKRVWFDKGLSSKLKVLQKYTYTLALENSVDEDYVTEKFFEPFMSGTIPIYLGAPNVDAFAPGENCYVDASRFSSFETLADYLETADPTQFHAWRNKALRPEFLSMVEMVSESTDSRLSRLLQQRLSGSA